MTETEEIFHRIVSELPNGIEGRMFGAMSIKSINGKTAAFYWKENMVFKLDEVAQKEALKLDGSKVGSHLYAPERQMKGWICITEKHSDMWADFAKKALAFVAEM